MKLPTIALLAGILLAACNTAYQTVETAPADVEAALSQAQRDSLDLEMRKALSFANEYYKQSRYEEAKVKYLQALELGAEEKYSGQLRKLATCYIQLGQPDSAITVLEQAVEKRPDSWYEHRVLGDLYNRSGMTDKAFAEFKICVDLNGDDWESLRDLKAILRNRAEGSGELDDWDLVIEQLDALIELQPDQADWAQEKDRILAEHYDPEELIASLRRNHEQFPDDIGTTRKLANALVEYATPESWREALGLLDRLIAAEPGTARFLEQKATALEGLGRVDDAAAVLQKLMELQPDKADLPGRVGELYLGAGNLASARRWAQRAQRSFPDHGRGFVLMAKVYEAAVDQCASGDLKFDDKLVYERAALEYDKVTDAAWRSVARQRRAALEEVLPSAEDRFFNKHDVPKGECYKWLFE